jgi:signal transduction histidine kinase
MSFLNPNIRKTIIFDILLVLIGLAGIYQLVQRAGFNTTSDVELRVTDTRRLVFEKIINTDLTSVFADKDTLVAIDNYPISSVDQLEVVTDSREIGARLVLLVSRSGKVITLTVPIKEFYSLSYIFIALFVGAVFFFHGLFVLINRPDDRAVRVYHWVSIWAAMIIMTTWGRYTIEPLGLGYLVRIIFCAAYAFTPVIFFHFSLLFPHQKWSYWKKIIIPGYILASILFLWTSVSFLIAIIPTISIKYVRIYLLGFDSTRWFFIVFLISGILNFIHSFIIASDAVERKKILWLLLGMIGPLSFVILWQIPQALNYNAILPEEVIILIASMMPLTFTISIIRYHIMDIYLIVNRSTVYGIVVVILLALYALIIAIAMKVIDTFTTESSIITSAFAAIFLALLFDPVRKQVQKFVDKKFFRVKYNYRLAQRKFLDEMNMGIDPKILALFTVDKLDELLQPKCINLLLIKDEQGQLTTYAKKNCILADESYIEELKNMTTYSSYQIFSYPDQIEPGISFKEIDIKGNHGLSIVLPIRRQNGTLLGLLCLGKKRSENFYSLEDVDLLLTVMTQLGLATERLRLQGRLLLKQEETKKLDELNKMQSFFISSVSHDLQTPLTAINMYLDLIQEKKNLTNSKRSDYLDTIRGESSRLSKWINNFLDISKIERGVRKYDFSNLNLNKFIHRVLTSMKYQLSQHEFKIDVDLPDVQINIQGDEDSLDRALTNLILNSIKYSTKEKYLSIKLRSHDNHALIEIADKGVGIDPEDQKRIFNIFYRSEKKHIQTISGAGLGLAIVDHVVKAHQGKIKLESKPGEGSRFTIRIPIQ